MDNITMTGDSPLGQQSEYPDEYSAGLLFTIERAECRAARLLGELNVGATTTVNQLALHCR